MYQFRSLCSLDLAEYSDRLLGNFPAQAEDALLSLTWLEQAKIREHPVDEGILDGGLDVAGPGEDETVLAIRCGPKLLHLESWTESDPRAARCWRRLKCSRDESAGSMSIRPA